MAIRNPPSGTDDGGVSGPGPRTVVVGAPSSLGVVVSSDGPVVVVSSDGIVVVVSPAGIVVVVSGGVVVVVVTGVSVTSITTVAVARTT